MYIPEPTRMLRVERGNLEAFMNNNNDDEKRASHEPVEGWDPEKGILSKDVQELIGRKLRQSYAGLVADPLPDRIGQLLDRLSKSDGPSAKPNKNSDGSGT